MHYLSTNYHHWHAEGCMRRCNSLPITWHVQLVWCGISFVMNVSSSVGLAFLFCHSEAAENWQTIQSQQQNSQICSSWSADLDVRHKRVRNINCTTFCKVKVGVAYQLLAMYTWDFNLRDFLLAMFTVVVNFPDLLLAVSTVVIHLKNILLTMHTWSYILETFCWSCILWSLWCHSVGYI